MSCIAGIDLSSYALHCAVIEVERDDEPYFMEYTLGKKRRDSLITRIGFVYGAVAAFGFTYPKRISMWPGLYVALEEPRGQGRLAVPATWGALVGELGRNMVETASLSSGEWRGELGVRDTKAEGHGAVMQWMILHEHALIGDVADEHRLDALGVALAWRSMLRKQEAA